MITLSDLFTEYKKPGPYSDDILEHLDTLKDLASECEHVTEMGFRWGTSFSALLMGKPKRAITYDLYIPPEPMAKLYLAAQREGIEAIFHQQDTLLANIEPTDLLFIDTLHTFAQLTDELKLHGNKARKYLAFHDTTSFGDKGEDGTTPGLWQAIDDFMENNPEWKLKARYTNNNGLTVLQRT